MCGIAGILRVHQRRDVPGPLSSIPELWLDILDDGIRHRGPDGHGRCRARAERPDSPTVDCALVHRRLSIIDHSGGAQPMVLRTPDPAVSLVFNGCIYNHRELRTQLRSLGASFHSDHSDTEVLLLGWAHWQLDLFRRLDGMFAAAIFDHASARLILARDCYGEKPLFQSSRSLPDGSSLLAFASTPAPLLQLNSTIAHHTGEDFKPVDPACAAQWIKFGFGPHTPFTHIESVTPGAVSVSHSFFPDTPHERPGRVTHHSFTPRVTHHAELPSIESLDHAITRSVISRLDADVPIGCFLSGGVDSALVAAIAAKSRPELPAFTVRMPEPAIDESELAAATAASIGVPHTILDCNADPAADLVNAITSLLLPFGDSSLLPTTWVSRAARSHVKVALTGDGGDELFAGYDRHRSLRAIFALSMLPRPINTLARGIFDVASTSNRRSRAARLFGAASGRDYRELLAIFPAPLDAAIGLRPASAFTRFDGDCESFMDLARDVDITSYLRNDLLLKTDTASMSVALEARAPLLSTEIRDLIRSCPAWRLVQLGPKALLRAVAAAYLPSSVLNRPKRGFAIPIGRWFREDYGGLGTLLRDSFASADPWPASLTGIDIDRRATSAMLSSHLAGTKDHSQRLYQLLVLAIWCRHTRHVLTPRHAEGPHRSA